MYEKVNFLSKMYKIVREESKYCFLKKLSDEVKLYREIAQKIKDNLRFCDIVSVTISLLGW